MVPQTALSSPLRAQQKLPVLALWPEGIFITLQVSGVIIITTKNSKRVFSKLSNTTFCLNPNPPASFSFFPENVAYPTSWPVVQIHHKEKYIWLPAPPGLQQPKDFSCFHLPAASPVKGEWRDCLHLSTALKSFVPPLSFCWIDTVPGSQCLWAPACFQAWQWWITYNHKLGTNQLSICLFQTSCFSFCIIEVPMPCSRMPTA